MNGAREHIASLLKQLLDGELTLEQCSTEVAGLASLEIGDFARLDTMREERTGFPEIVFAPGKSLEQLEGIIGGLIKVNRHNIVVSKLDETQFNALSHRFPEARYHELSATAVFRPGETPPSRGAVGIVTAGTSDLPVAEEIGIALEIAGSRTSIFADAGVAGIDRTLRIIPELRKMNVVICLAGMEGALPSVLAGLLRAPVIAVPVSTGYGVNNGGYNALLSALGSCAPGIVTVNIDNGIGAAAAAHKINTLIADAHDRS